MTIVIPEYILYLIAWFGLGLLGSYAIYYSHCKAFPYQGWCPSPLAIVACIVGSVAGVVIFVIGLMIALFEYMDKPNWWNTPSSDLTIP